MTQRPLLLILVGVAAFTMGDNCSPGDPNNQPPSAANMVIATVLDQVIQGTMTSCLDDGRPNPPGQCTQEVEIRLASNLAVIVGQAIVSGGNWTLTGLSPSTSYAIQGSSSDSQKGSYATGAGYRTTGPSPPTVTVTEATGGESASVSGTISACTGNCTSQEVNIYYDTVTCDRACHCTPVPSFPAGQPAIPSGGSWEIPVLLRQTSYVLYGRNRYADGQICSDPVYVTTPYTIAGCSVGAVAHYHQIPESAHFGPGVRGTRARWTIRQPVSTDWEYYGFTQQGIWANFRGYESDETARWLEHGVTRGLEGQNTFAYFWAWGDRTTDDFQDNLRVGPTPPVGQQGTFKIANCGVLLPTLSVQPGCVTQNDRRWVMCDEAPSELEYGQPNPNCQIFEVPESWPNQIGSYKIGGETTCIESSRLDSTYAEKSQFLYSGNVWAFSNYLDEYVPQEPRSFINKYPQSTHLGFGCCDGTGHQEGTFWRCDNPNKTRYWINSQTPTTSCAP